MSLPPLPKAAKGGRPWFLEDTDNERLLNMVIALAAEVSVLHDKVDSLTRVAGRAEPFAPEAVEAFQPDAETAKARAERRAAFIERVLRIVHADAERALQDGPGYDEIMARVAGDGDR